MARTQIYNEMEPHLHVSSKSEVSLPTELKKLPETEVSALPEKVSSEIQVNISNKSCPPISTLPDDPEEK